MAKASTRSSTNTDLYIGTLKASIGLFGTEAKPVKAEDFSTAGPNGGVLRYETKGAPAPVSDAGEAQGVKDDPFGEIVSTTATVEVPPVDIPGAPPADPVEQATDVLLHEQTTSVPGEFRRVLVEEGTGVEVEPEDVRRGVRLESGAFVDCTEQIAAIVERTKLDRIEVVACIDSTQIRRERVIGSYYVGATNPEAAPVLRLLYEALRARREVAVVKYTTRSRQQLGVIAPNAKTGTLMLLSLIFQDDFREAPAKARAIAKVEVPARQVEAMGALLGALHATADVFDTLRDDALALREELRVRAEAGEMDAAVVEPLSIADELPSLEDALAASLEAVAGGKG